MPKNINEKEIAGYRDVIKIISENFDSILINKNFILQLHKIPFSYTSNGMLGKKECAKLYQCDFSRLQ